MSNGVSVDGISDKGENVFLDEENEKKQITTEADAIKETQQEIIALCSKNGGQGNEKLMTLLKTYDSSGNPNRIKDIGQVS